MTVKRKKASEATSSRTAQAAPVVEAIAFGAASGALALGVAEQAAAARAQEVIGAAAAKKAARKDDAADPADAAPVAAQEQSQAGQSARVVTEAASVPAPEAGAGSAAAANDLRQAATATTEAAPERGTAEPDARPPAQSAAADLAPPGDRVPEGTRVSEATTVAAAPAEREDAVWSEPPEAAALPDSAALAARVSDQIIGAIDTMAQKIAAGVPANEVGRSFASEILDAATGMVREVELAVPKSEEIADRAKTTIDETLDSLSLSGTVPELADTSDQIAELADTADEITELAGETASSLLVTLPTKLLGAETDEADGGLLSELFYSDGAAPGPAPGALASDALPLANPPRISETAPDQMLLPDIGSDLSDSAATIVDGFDPLPVTLAGVSYLDGTDMPYSGMQSSLGALHVV